MGKRCKHDNVDHLFPGDASSRGFRLAPFIADVEQLRCLDCFAWLGLNEPASMSPEVDLEIDALEHWLPFAPYFDDHCDCTCDGCQKRHLANVIFEHRENHDAEVE